MAEIKLKFDLTFSRRFIAFTGAAAMMLCAVPELDSESVTLSTYYPAPSGVYTNMITTGNTYLARDGGAASKVGIGTASPLEKLVVVGKGAFSDKIFASNYYPTGAGGMNANAMEVGGANPTAASGQATIYFHHHSVIAHQLRYNNGTLALEAAGNGYGTSASPALSVGGAIISRQGSSCSPMAYGLGVVSCGGGSYATYISGVLVKWQASSGTSDNSGTMFCCPCPAAGCAATFATL